MHLRLPYKYKYNKVNSLQNVFKDIGLCFKTLNKIPTKSIWTNYCKCYFSFFSHFKAAKAERICSTPCKYTFRRRKYYIFVIYISCVLLKCSYIVHVFMCFRHSSSYGPCKIITNYSTFMLWKLSFLKLIGMWTSNSWIWFGILNQKRVGSPH